MPSIFSALLADSRQSVQYMTREITRICKTLPKRAPGSAGERTAAEDMAAALHRACGCGDVKIEAFKEHTSAFYQYFRLSGTLDCLCAVGFFLSPWLGLVFGVLDLLLFLFQFVLYRQIIDPLFPEKESVNVTALRPCSGEIRQRIFLNGHIDAAWEFPLNLSFWWRCV